MKPLLKSCSIVNDSRKTEVFNANLSLCRAANNKSHDVSIPLRALQCNTQQKIISNWSILMENDAKICKGNDIKKQKP